MYRKGSRGAVLKNLFAPYSFDRGKGWWKVIYTTSGDYEIIGALEGKGRNKGKLGAFIVNVDGKEVQVGGGIKKDERTTFWDMYNTGEIIGMVAQVEYREKTKDGSLRFPEFLRLRPDK